LPSFFPFFTAMVNFLKENENKCHHGVVVVFCEPGEKLMMWQKTK
jgi:hypothetical protein